MRHLSSQYFNDVESAKTVLSFMRYEIELRSEDNASYLISGYRLDRLSESRVFSRLDFDEHKRVFILGDDIYLTRFRSIITLQNPVALFFEIFCGDILAFYALTSVVHLQNF